MLLIRQVKVRFGNDADAAVAIYRATVKAALATGRDPLQTEAACRVQVFGCLSRNAGRHADVVPDPIATPAEQPPACVS